jgi:Flp pilus assembly protein TadG
VIVVPVILLALMMVVQFSLAYYARQVLAGATQDGAAAAARQGSNPTAGQVLADQLIDEAGRNLLASHTTAGSATGTTVTVTATGKVVSLLPFFGSITVRASGSAHVEEFDPQGTGP